MYELLCPHRSRNAGRRALPVEGFSTQIPLSTTIGRLFGIWRRVPATASKSGLQGCATKLRSRSGDQYNQTTSMTSENQPHRFLA